MLKLQFMIALLLWKLKVAKVAFFQDSKIIISGNNS